MKKLLATEMVHTIMSLIIAMLVYRLFDSVFLAGMAILTGVLIDTDHFFDYLVYITKNNLRFSIREFFRGDYFCLGHKVYIPLHGWEFVVILLGLYFLTHLPVFLVMGVSFLGHLLVDQFTNDVKILSYFFLYRAAWRFDKRTVCVEQ